MAVLVPALVALRDEFNQLNPDRDKTTDGWIGDTSHSARPSDHNPDETGNTPHEDDDSKDEVHAIDVDKTGPWPDGLTFDVIIETIRDRCRRNVENRLMYIIWNGRIAEWDNGWQWRTYTGENPHKEHAHFSCEYASKYSEDTSPWGVADLGGLPMDQNSFNKLMNGWAATAEGKTALERAAISDVVDRVDPANDYAPLPDTDGNPTMAVNAALYYLARDLARLDDKVDALAAGATKTVTPAPKPAAPKPAVKR